MQVLGIVAPGADREALASLLTARLADEGTVGVLRQGEAAGPESGHADAPERTVYTVHDGGWSACGTDATPRALLDRLAPDHDYAVALGFPDLRVPTLVVGEADCQGEVVSRAEKASAVDADAVAAAVAESEPYETLASLVARAKQSPRAERAGAIATFTGRVRARDAPDDAWTDSLEFEKYAGVADERLATIREELAAREGVFEVLLHHRTGVVEYGEDIVFVVVLAGHREEAFRTVEDGINRLKAEVPLFKKEVTVDDEFWVHERP